MSTITLNSKSYVGAGILNLISIWWERSLGIATLFSQLTNRVVFQPTLTLVAWKLTVPIVPADPDCCVPTVLKDTIVDVNIRFDKAAPQAHRDDVLQRVQDLIASVPFETSVSSLQQQT